MYLQVEEKLEEYAITDLYFQDERACDQKASLYPFDSEDTELHIWLVLSMLHGGTDVKLSKLSMAPYASTRLKIQKYLSCHPARLPEKHLGFGGMTGGPKKHTIQTIKPQEGFAWNVRG